MAVGMLRASLDGSIRSFTKSNRNHQKESCYNWPQWNSKFVYHCLGQHVGRNGYFRTLEEFELHLTEDHLRTVSNVVDWKKYPDLTS